MQLNLQTLKDVEFWNKAEVRLPNFDIQEMKNNTDDAPEWIHFGAGNIFRAFIANISQRLLEKGLTKTGIVAVDTFDFDIIEKVFKPFDLMTVGVSLLPDGNTKNEIIASIANGLCGGKDFSEDVEKIREIFKKPSLSMVSFTVTEKGYALKNIKGEYFPFVEQDFKNGPQNCSHVMSFITALLFERYNSCKKPIAVVSMDNCSHNGEKLRNSVLDVAEHWQAEGFVDNEFVAWVSDEKTVSFPWSMIDKITPRPAQEVEDMLKDKGIEDMSPIVTSKNTYIAPFVNAELPEYLVIEDSFPNGRPPLEQAGVLLTDRKTVNDTETMKVTTCLNPLHTALAVYGCVLGYTSIAKEMQDEQLKKLVELIGYKEGLPVVVDPKIIDPKQFIKEVIEQRLPNPFIPDTPQRIATDTSQKVGIRFGETIKAYIKNSQLDVLSLKYIPLALAGWIRYLLAIDDNGQPFECSSDPMLETLQLQLAEIEFLKPESVGDKLKPILSNENLFGVDLVEAGLYDAILTMVCEMLEGKNAVRNCLAKYIQ